MIRSEIKIFNSFIFFLFLILLGSAGKLNAETVNKILIKGNIRTEKESILQKIKTKEGKELDPALISEDINSVYSLGLFEKIDVYRINNDLIFKVQEKPAILEVLIEGNEEIDETTINDEIAIKPFSIYDQKKVSESLKKILELYKKEGFFMAKVEYRLIKKSQNTLQIKFIITENSKVRVKQILIGGNKKFTDKELKGQILTQEENFISFVSQAGIFRREFLEADLQRLRKFYNDRGYVNFRADNPETFLSKDRKSLIIHYNISEGEQYRIGKLDITGDFPDDKKKLLGLIRSKEGDIFNASLMLKDSERLTRFFQDLGFAYVNINQMPREIKEKKLLDFSFNVERGERIFIERIDINGNDSTADKVIRRELRIYEGDLYSKSKIERSKRRVKALGFFDEVEISDSPGVHKKTVVLKLKVKERQVGTIRAGLGFSSASSVFVSSQISNQNLFGRGQTLSLNLQFSANQDQQFSLNFYEPYLLDTKISLGLELFYIKTRYNYTDFERTRRGSTISAGYWLSDDLRLSLQYTIAMIGQTDLINSSRNVAVNSTGLTSEIGTKLTSDTRDDRMFPTDGSYYSAEVAVASSLIGSQYEFMRLEYNYKKFYPIISPLEALENLGVLRFNMILQTVHRLSSIYLPYSEKYLLGGATLKTNLRGYAFYSVSPVSMVLQDGSNPSSDTRVFNDGGNKMALFNFEYEIPIVKQARIYFVLFFDMGNVFSENENWFYAGDRKLKKFERLFTNGGNINGLDPREDLFLGLYKSWGFGVRWFSPFGPLRFEFGIPLNRRVGIDEESKFEFAIGNAF